MAELAARPDVPVTPLDLGPFDGKVELVCKACGKTGKYHVGRICVDAPKGGKVAAVQVKQEDSVYFTGYFHCGSCGAGGPWTLPPLTQILLVALALEAAAAPEKARIHFGRPQLFDGTVFQCATAAEAHLKKLLEGKPDDAFLWSRLGNLYENAEQPDLAFAAFEKAVALNPEDVESRHSLGCLWMDRNNDPAQAAAQFQAVLQQAHTATRVRQQMLRDIVRDSLGRLRQLHEQFPAVVPSLPPLATGIAALADDPLDPEGDADDLVGTVLSGNLSPLVAPPPNPRWLTAGAAASSPRPPQRVGRNDPCPCGSGRKFKKCCGQDR